MSSRASWLALLATLALTPAARAVTLVERPGHVTEASVTVDGSPAEVYALVTDYANWRRVFTDVESVSVTRGGREHAQVRFRSRAFGNTVNVQFDNVPGRMIRFRGDRGPHGAKAGGDYALTPLDGGTRTRITARFYLDVDGPAALFVREKKLRGIRRAKLTADLTDAQRRFARSRSVSSWRVHAEPARQ
jgi:hypothetical protein